MSDSKKGVKPIACTTGNTGKTGKTDRSKTTGKTGSSSRVRKPLTPEQRKRKQERDRKYRLRHNRKKISGRLVKRDDQPVMTRGVGNLCGDLPCEQCSEYERCRTFARTTGFKPLRGVTLAELDRREREASGRTLGCADAASDARKWLTGELAAIQPGERKVREFRDGRNTVRVEVGCGDRPREARPASAAKTLFDELVGEILHTALDIPRDRCGRGPRTSIDFSDQLPAGIASPFANVLPAFSGRRIHDDIHRLVASRRGWLTSGGGLAGLS